MNSLYTKIISVIVALVLLALAIFGVLWQNNRTINQAADRSADGMAQIIAAQRETDALAYEARIRDLEGKVNENWSQARQRVAEVDQRQRRDTAALIRRIDGMPDNEVGDPIAAVLEESRTRWPE